jgi:hypothetical protein
MNPVARTCNIEVPIKHNRSSYKSVRGHGPCLLHIPFLIRRLREHSSGKKKKHNDQHVLQNKKTNYC